MEAEEFEKLIDNAKDKIDVGDYAYAKDILDDLKEKIREKFKEAID